ncbi:MAG: hypothetical protein RR540_09225, partial [Oscillospiraceae bacterium]
MRRQDLRAYTLGEFRRCGGEGRVSYCGTTYFCRYERQLARVLLLLRGKSNQKHAPAEGWQSPPCPLSLACNFLRKFARFARN